MGKRALACAMTQPGLPAAGVPDAWPASPEVVEAFLDEFRRRLTPAELPASTYADLSELVEDPNADPALLGRSLARLVHDVRLYIDLRLDSPLKSTIEDEDFTFASLSPAMQRELAPALLAILKRAAARASHQALHEHLPGGAPQPSP